MFRLSARTARPHRRRLATPPLAAALALALAVAGCEEGAAPTAEQSETQLSATGHGNTAAHRQLARHLALALREEGVRHGLLEAMDASPFHEGKVFLDTELQGPVRGLVAQMARAGGTTVNHVKSLIREAPPLEVYLPVPEHRDAWDGGSEYLVATVLEEGATPFGVDPGGREISLTAESPPSTPTIVLVPAESFTDDGEPRQELLPDPDPVVSRFICCSGGGGSVWTPPGAATWQRNIGIRERISHFRYWDQHEGWPNGEAEFYIVLGGTQDTDDHAELTKKIFLTDDVWGDSYDEGEWVLWDQLKLIDWDTDYGTRVRIRCMESDGAPDISLLISGITEIFGVDVEFEGSIQNGREGGDDPCGQDYITPRFSNGEWSLIPDGDSPEFDGTSDLQWYGYGIDVTS